MPNWCENNLTLSGKEKKLIEFNEKVKTNNYKLLSTFLPLPKELKDTEAPNSLPIALTGHLTQKYGANNWYDWQLKNWGCKWDCELYPNGFSKNKQKLYYAFDSPWAPPEAGIQQISAIYPEIEFTINYDEPGMGFKGTSTYKDGLLTKEIYKNY